MHTLKPLKILSQSFKHLAKRCFLLYNSFMIKAILFDADGVILKSHRYFTEVCAEKHSLSLESISPFFRGLFQKCQTGEADLKEAIAPYLEDFKWPKTLEEYLQEWFVSDSQIEESLLAYVASLRSNGIRCYLATDQEKYRADYVKNDLGLSEKFDDLFFSCNLKSLKSDFNFFNQIIEQLDIEPSGIMYFDDDAANIEVAKSAGINAHVFTDLEQVKKIIEENI